MPEIGSNLLFSDAMPSSECPRPIPNSSNSSFSSEEGSNSANFDLDFFPFLFFERCSEVSLDNSWELLGSSTFEKRIFKSLSLLFFLEFSSFASFSSVNRWFLPRVNNSSK